VKSQNLEARSSRIVYRLLIAAVGLPLGFAVSHAATAEDFSYHVVGGAPQPPVQVLPSGSPGSRGVLDVPVQMTLEPDWRPIEPQPAPIVAEPIIIDGQPHVNADVYFDNPGLNQAWTWQALPDGLIYRSYLAGVKEPRMAANWMYELQDDTFFLDAAIGGRVGILRYGTQDDFFPQGWQLDAEAAAFPRLNLDEEWDLDVVDYRVGVPLTYGVGRWRYKLAWYHLSAHLGDEFIDRVPGSIDDRINYSRDVALVGISFYATPALRFYGEAGYGFELYDGAEPWEFQFGIDYSPAVTGLRGAPFFAVNGHLREEVDFGGNVVGQAGWQWRGESGQTFRIGAQYFNGKSNQFEFFDEFEEQIGFVIWYDY